MCVFLASVNFYPRPPRGGRPEEVEKFGDKSEISIHALREEGDDGKLCLTLPRGISIHALREEGDVCGGKLGLLNREFLSTPSARRATRGSRHVRCKEQISIHALREEGDAVRPPFFASCF